MLRWIAFAALAISSFAAAPRPRHDPPDQPFRRAPMAQSSRSVVVNLSSNLHAAFDTDLCRIHTIWLGGPLNLFGPPYSNSKSPFICDFEGKVVFSFPQLQPWGQPARFKGIHSRTNRLAVDYEVGEVRVSEAVAGATLASNMWVFRRNFTFEPCSPPELLVFAEPGASATVNGDAVEITSTNGTVRIYADLKADWRIAREQPNYESEIITEAGTEKGNPRLRHTLEETRVYLRLGPETKRLSLTLANVESPPSPKAIFGSARATFQGTSEVRRPSGDDFYRIEHFPLPPEAELIITGMDALPNGDLVICTWLGEVFVVEGASGPVERATYRRIARGLNEPLGVSLSGTNIYIVQKGELTHLIDTDHDGEIDNFRCISAGWGFSGNYHSYTFGPVMTDQNEFMVFVTGQRGRADLLYQGWALQITGSGSVTPWCDGLRVPHGTGHFQGDVFVTDNQGNWIGACRLNHIQRGRFYGFPSSRPSPQGTRPAADVAAPALWFPRALSPSTSGFAEVGDERFGPFQGQLMIGDFQNAIVMRAFLEKVNGEWQGAVFPFARGFLSGVNRLTMNRDGRLYVAGGKRTWSTAAPKEYALERVSFTGKVPFEVREVRAERDGFTLVFTREFDREAAQDPENYLVKQFTYRYHSEYGSPEFDHSGKAGATELPVSAVEVSQENKTVRLVVPGLRTGFVTSFQLAVTSSDDEDLRHDTFYYTLNELPGQSQ